METEKILLLIKVPIYRGTVTKILVSGKIGPTLKTLVLQCTNFPWNIGPGTIFSGKIGLMLIISNLNA